MSQTLNTADEQPTDRFLQARERLFDMVAEGRSFSGHERNCCYLNTRDGRFADISAISGMDFADDGRALALVDWDQDGDLDVWTSNRNAPRLRFLRNDVASSNNYLALKLRGSGSGTPRDAIGARVEVIVDDDEAEGMHFVGSLRAGEGFLAQSSKWLHFGLGTFERIKTVVVHWPGGEPQQFSGLEVNGRYLLVQGAGRPEPMEFSRNGLRLAASPAELPQGATLLRVPLVSRVPMPTRGVYRGFDGVEHRISFGDRPLLVNLWASWCAPCLSELREFADRSEEIRNANVQVIALSVDRLAEQGVQGADAAAALARLQFPFPAGWADEPFTMAMQGYHNQLVALRRPLPVPTSLLVDNEGRLAVIYKGRLSVDQLLRDVADLAEDGQAPSGEAAFLPGRVIDDPRASGVRRQARIRTQFDLARTLQQAGRLEDAVEHFDELLKLAPDCAPAWQHMAVALEGRGNSARALTAYRRALQLEPEVAWLHYNAANALTRLGSLDEALDGYRRALELDADYVEARVNLGAALVQLKRYDEALEEFRRAVASRPDFAPARDNLRRLQDFLQSRQ